MNSGGHREPMQGFEDGCDALIFMHSHQHPDSTILHELEVLDTLVRDLDEKYFAVVQLRGDRAIDTLLCIR